MYGFRLEQPEANITAMHYRRYNTRPSGLVVPDSLGFIAVLTNEKSSRTSSGIDVPNFLETALFGGGQSHPRADLDIANDTLQGNLDELNTAARAEWGNTLKDRDPLTVHTFLTERRREVPEQPTEFDGYIATPSEIAVIEGIAAYLQQGRTASNDEPGMGLYL
jgi:hypothetical protein